MNAINLRSGVATTNIHIKPQDFKATVYLQGKVSTCSPVEQWAYQLQDSTGTIWVLTNQGLQLEDKVLIKGNIHYQSIP